LTFEVKAKAKDLASEAEAKAKDLTFEAKAMAKDTIGWPQGASRPRPCPRGLQLWKCQCLKSNNCKQDNFYNNTFYECVVQQQGGHIKHFM